MSATTLTRTEVLWMLHHHAQIANRYAAEGNRRMARSERRFVKRLYRLLPA